MYWGRTCQRFNWVVHAFCQMSNHHHLLLKTVDGNLARGMRHLNGEYTLGFSSRHALVVIKALHPGSSDGGSFMHWHDEF